MSIHHGRDDARPGTRFELALFAFVRAVLVGFGRVWFRVSARGREHVPAEGAFILAPVHRSNIDFLLVLICTRRRIRFLAKDTLFVGFWDKLFTALGGIPVARGTADREALQTCIAVVQAGEPLVVFPEGTRQFGPTVCEMFDGPSYVACRAQVPILPIGLGGTEAAMPKGAKLPRPRKLVIVIGEPIYPPPPPPSGRVPRRAVRELTQQLGEEIQVLFDEAQVLAGTPNQTS